jgi:glycosyltransferase involved in cell wall biosynthesis
MTQSGESKPLVTVVTPTYNRASFLPETIDSVLSQSYQNIEYIVLDDGSTDNTREVLELYGKRIRWESHNNMGESLTVNKGWSMARGDLIVTVNSDDPILPGLIETGVEFMNSHPDVLVAYPDWLMIDPGGMVLDEIKTCDYNYLNMVRWNRCFPGPGTFIRKKCFALTEMRNPEYCSMADFDYWLRLGLHGPFARIPHTLATWRYHPQALSITSRGEAMAKEYIKLTKSFFERADLPSDVRALKAETTAVSYFFAGDVCYGPDFTLTRKYWRRCLMQSAFRMKLFPNGRPICWDGYLTRLLWPSWIYRNTNIIRKYARVTRSGLKKLVKQFLVKKNTGSGSVNMQNAENKKSKVPAMHFQQIAKYRMGGPGHDL